MKEETVLEKLLELVRHLEDKANKELRDATVKREAKMEVLIDIHGTIIGMQMEEDKQKSEQPRKEQE